jgi:hypothetical protein
VNQTVLDQEPTSGRGDGAWGVLASEASSDVRLFRGLEYIRRDAVEFAGVKAALVGMTGRDLARPGVAKRLRSTAVRSCVDALFPVGRVLGPEPLVGDGADRKRVADLTISHRQRHRERDDASVHRTIRESDLEW